MLSKLMFLGKKLFRDIHKLKIPLTEKSYLSEKLNPLSCLKLNAHNVTYGHCRRRFKSKLLEDIK